MDTNEVLAAAMRGDADTAETIRWALEVVRSQWRDVWRQVVTGDAQAVADALWMLRLGMTSLAGLVALATVDRGEVCGA